MSSARDILDVRCLWVNQTEVPIVRLKYGFLLILDLSQRLVKC